MIRIVQIYKNIDQLRHYLKECSFFMSTSCLVQITTSNMNHQEAQTCAREIKQLLPNAQIVGVSSSHAIIFDGKRILGATLVTIEKYHSSQVILQKYSWERQSAQQLAKQFVEDFQDVSYINNGIIHTLFSGEYHGSHQFIEEVNALNPQLRLTGGTAGDIIGHQLSGFVFDEHDVYIKGMIAFCVSSKLLNVYVGVSTSLEEVSNTHEITKVDKKQILEIDHVNAIEWANKFFNYDLRQNQWSNIEQAISNDYLIHFPMMIDNTKSCRFARLNQSSDTLELYHTYLKKGTKFKVGYLNPQKVVGELVQICEEILDQSIEYLSIYTSYYRSRVMENEVQWELLPFDKFYICGGYLAGQIAYFDGKNHFSNGLLQIIGKSESEKYIIPNITALEETAKVWDYSHFYLKAKELSRININSSNQNDAHKYLMDSQMGLPNIFKFNQMLLHKKYDKVTLIEIVAADALIAYAGSNSYYQFCREVISMIQQYMDKKAQGNLIDVYSMNYKHFFFCANHEMDKKDYIQISRELSKIHELTVSKQMGLSSVLRFIVVDSGENQLEIATKIATVHRKSQETLIIADEHTQLVDEDEHHIIELLNYAIDHDLVEPYFQGIRDNKTGVIAKYEALMRVIDHAGQVYTPFSFMVIAKKYHFYTRISQLMIKKTLLYFRNKESEVTLNLTRMDFMGEDKGAWLLELLHTFPNPKRITIEFVESEKMHDIGELVSFIKQLKKIGVRIAVDDFGSGYSNFLSVVDMMPDVIKIDGSIISTLRTSKESRILLNTITFLSNELGIMTIAEFVETQEIQDILDLYGVDYSQGYLYSVPKSIHDLDRLKHE